MERFESGSQAFDTLDSLSAGGWVGATCGLQDPKGRTTGGEDRDPTRLMTPGGVGGFITRRNFLEEDFPISFI